MARLILLLAVPALVLGLSTVALGAPAITLDWTPRLPDHVENPGGTFYGQCWVDVAGTTPLDLTVMIKDPDGIVIYETVVPDGTYYYITWNVPDGSPDGVYVYEAVYRAEEGDIAAGRAGFLVAGALTGLAAVKFYDDNGNGVYDAGEAFGEGWEICATGPEDLGCQFTDEFGIVTWFNVQTGLYEVCETPQDGYVCTTCDAGYCISLEVLPDEINKATFGNFIPPVAVEPSTWGRIKAIYR